MADAAWEHLDPVAQEMLQASRARVGAVLRGRLWASRWGFAIALLVAAAALVAWAPSQRSFEPLTFALLVGGYAIASRVQLEVGTGFGVPTELVFVPMLFALPARAIPLAVAAGLVAAHLPEVLRRQGGLDSVAAAVGSAWFTFAPAAILIALHEPSAEAHNWVLLPLLLAAQFAADFLSTSAREWAALGVRPRQLVAPMKWVFAIDALLAPMGLAAALAGRESPLGLLLPLPLLFLVDLFARERKAGLDRALELSQAYRGTALLLGDVIEVDDAYTGSHSRQVVALTLEVADRLGITARERRDAELTALLHDVGKIRIPNDIIRKAGPLSPVERALVETHTIEGQALLLRVGGLLGEVGHLVRSCHERWDGGGYPDGLAGEEIPRIARIVCCCDAFNAMTTNRPYRKALSLEQALSELRACSGAQFDPKVVEVLVELVETNAVPLLAGDSPDF
jgi:HD-GYP domain-containing protein (c-di-GMP phosphodiesterase class II)